MSCPSCSHRTRADLGPCAGCGAVAVPFLDGYLNVPPPEPFGPRYTVPWDPEAGEEIKGRTLRAVRLAATIANDRGWSAEALRRLAHWHSRTIEAACFRMAVRWGLIL